METPLIAALISSAFALLIFVGTQIWTASREQAKLLREKLETLVTDLAAMRREIPLELSRTAFLEQFNELAAGGQKEELLATMYFRELVDHVREIRKLRLEIVRDLKRQYQEGKAVLKLPIEKWLAMNAKIKVTTQYILNYSVRLTEGFLRRWVHCVGP